MNSIGQATDCSCNPCPDTSSGGTGPIGPKGDTGAAGANGSDGVDAFTTTTANFTMPAVNSNVADVAVLKSTWMVVGQILFVQSAGYMQVVSKTDATHVTLKNLGYTGNAAPTTVIASPQTVSPAGIKGTDGAAGSQTLNNLSPTTTKGDLIVDNGANNPAANDVRLAAGTNGQILCADSTAGTGIAWKTVVPVSVTADNAIPRFNGASGTPTPLQDSLMAITDDGAIQSSPSGGNARGSKAVDFQVDRAANTQVASGADAVVAGGKNNTASGAQSVVSGGDNNVASNLESVVGGGTTNQATGSASGVCCGDNNTASGSASVVSGGSACIASGGFSVVGGGDTNLASASQSAVLGGQNNIASAINSAVVGGADAVANKIGQIAHASGQFAAQGDAQVSELVARNNTADATPTNLFLDGSSAKIVIPVNTSWCFEVFVIGRSSAGVSAAWVARGGIQNNGGTCTMIAACTASVLADGTGGSWGVAGGLLVTADNVSKALNLVSTGAAATLIKFVAKISLVEVTY